MLNDALQYAEKGWQILPLHTIKDGKCTCGNSPCHSPGKHPRIRGGLNSASSDRDQINHWWQEYPDSNIGIRTGQASGFWALDVDPGHYGDNDSLDIIISELSNSSQKGGGQKGGGQKGGGQKGGGLPDTVQCLTGGGGLHYYYKADRPITNAVNLKTDKHEFHGIDIRGDGGYVVAPPSIHISGRNYEWEGSSDPADIEIAKTTQELATLLGLYKEHRAAAEVIDLPEADLDPNDISKIKQALDYISPDFRDDWLNVGMALHSTLGGSVAFDIWNEWSQETGRDNYSRTTQTKVWHSFKHRTHQINLETIYFNAQKKGWIYVPDDDAVLTIIDDISIKPEHIIGEQEAPLGVFSVGDLMIDPPALPAPLYRNHVLFQGGILLLSGPPKSGKSFLFQNMAMAASCGGDFLGHNFDRAVKVLWLQAEIHKAYVHQRLRGMIESFSEDEQRLISKNFYGTGRLNLDVMDHKDYEEIAKTVKFVNPDIICIDPVINFSSAEENNNTDVSKMLKRIIDLKQFASTDPTICLLHHTKKSTDTLNPFDSIRGAGAFRGVYDTGMLIIKEQGDTHLFYECRNGISPESHGIEMVDNRWIVRNFKEFVDDTGKSIDLENDHISPKNIERISFIKGYLANQKEPTKSSDIVQMMMKLFDLKKSLAYKTLDLMKNMPDIVVEGPSNGPTIRLKNKFEE